MSWFVWLYVCFKTTLLIFNLCFIVAVSSFFVLTVLFLTQVYFRKTAVTSRNCIQTQPVAFIQFMLTKVGLKFSANLTEVTHRGLLVWIS